MEAITTREIKPHDVIILFPVVGRVAGVNKNEGEPKR
jgi:hypothetical protein